MTQAPTTPKLSPNELLKASHPTLAGTIAQTLADAQENHFVEDDTQFLKFHGIYQQDDRDLRKTGKKYIFMVRCRIPGGVLTPAQYLACDDLSSRYADNTLRVTSRQGFQFHGVVKGGLRALVKEINDALLGTLAACGDNNRNVMAPPTPAINKLGEQVHEHARQVAAAVLPSTRAYHSIWIEGAPLNLEAPENRDFVDPLYGKTYLPRKFKIAFAIPPLNDIDIFTNCCGFIAIAEGSGKLFGYNLTAGGGMGRSHGNAATFPRVADLIGFLPPEKVVDVAKAVVTIHRDFGDRTDRKHARLKYVLEDRGVQWFREELQRRLSFSLAEPMPFKFERQGDAFGWNRQADGRLFLGLFVETGRIRDRDGWRMKTALREAIAKYQPQVRLTPANNVILANLARGAARRDHPSIRRTRRADRTRTPGEHPAPGFDGVRGSAHLRPGAGGGRALPARPDHARRTPARGGGAGRAGDHHSHDRLPERLRAALHGRDRFRRQGPGPLPGLARRQRSQHAPEPALSGRGQGPGHGE